LVPTPSYPLFDFLADLQDVTLVPYQLVYDPDGRWIFLRCKPPSDLPKRPAEDAGRIVVHPNNPTGSYAKRHEAEELHRICAANGLAIIADEVFLDYALAKNRPFRSPRIAKP